MADMRVARWITLHHPMVALMGEARYQYTMPGVDGRQMTSIMVLWSHVLHAIRRLEQDAMFGDRVLRGGMSEREMCTSRRARSHEGERGLHAESVGWGGRVLVRGWVTYRAKGVTG